MEADIVLQLMRKALEMEFDNREFAATAFCVPKAPGRIYVEARSLRSVVLTMQRDIKYIHTYNVCSTDS